MARSSIKQRAHWFALHGVIRGISKVFARRGDPQGRLLIDPTVRADPVAFVEELRALGRPVNLPSVTGARHPTRCGRLSFPPPAAERGAGDG